MFTPVILTIPALVLPLIMSPARDCQFGRLGDSAGDEQVLAQVELAVNDYASLHRRLEPAWPLPWLTGDLVLLDVHAGLVVDVLERALPTEASCAERLTAPVGEDFVGCAYEEAPPVLPQDESDHAKE